MTGCIADLHALVGVDINVLLLTSAGVRVTVGVIAQLVADIFIVSVHSYLTLSHLIIIFPQLVFGALGFVLALAHGAVYTALCALFAVVG